MGDLPYLDKVVNGHKFFFNPTDAIRVAVSPRIGVGPGFDSQGSVNFLYIRICACLLFILNTYIDIVYLY